MISSKSYFDVLKLIPKLGIRSIIKNLSYKLSKNWKFSKLRRIESEVPVGPFFTGITSDKQKKIEHYNDSWDDKQTYFSWCIKDDPNKPNWNSMCIEDKDYGETSKNWFDIKINKQDKDIKEVWEASRMDWLVTFSQKIAMGESIYLEKLNDWINDWLSQNPPYLGPNWTCAQEASIRLINLSIASLILDQIGKPTPGLISLIETHLKRIAPALNYSISQQNNHGTTEASALFIGGSWLFCTEKTSGKYFMDIGRKTLEERVESLISDDGVFSQYSTNYHRMFLDTVSFSELWRTRLHLAPFSPKLYSRTKAAVDWLISIIDPVSGDVPNIGSNDGSKLLPLLNTNFYRDYRFSAELAALLFYGKSAFQAGKHMDSFLSWLDLSSSKDSLAPPKSKYFDKGGFAVLHSQSAMVVFKYPRFEFRPSQEDSFHLDLWLRGRNILRDAGSFSYLPFKNLDYFSGPRGHNSIQFDNREQMPKISRFLYGRWPSTQSIETFRQEKEFMSLGASYQDFKKSFHKRILKLYDKKLVIYDEIKNFNETAILRWRLEPGDWNINESQISKENLTIEVNSSSEISSIKLVEGWESRFYLKKTPAPVLEVEIAGPSKVTSTIKW